MSQMMFGRVHRMSDADYSRWQQMIRQAQGKRVRIERPEVEGEPFRLLRYGEVLAESERMDLIQRVLMDL